MTRSERIRTAILNRIGAMGAMEIPIGRHALASLLSEMGQTVNNDHVMDERYEVPAIVLEAMVRVAVVMTLPIFTIPAFTPEQLAVALSGGYQKGGCVVLPNEPITGHEVLVDRSAPPVPHRGELERQHPDKAEWLRAEAVHRPDAARILEAGFVAWRKDVWVKVRLRQHARCEVSGSMMNPGAVAWRQLTSVRRRDHRVDARLGGVWA